ncbi:glycosyltransferase [Prevotella communis]
MICIITSRKTAVPDRSRNYGAERAQGHWLIVLDSDVVLPTAI